MAEGLQIFDASGNLTLDFSTKVGRVLGILTGVDAADSHTDSRFAEGTPWAVAWPSASRSGVFLPFIVGPELPEITFAGTTMTWADLPADNRRIVYGVY